MASAQGFLRSGRVAKVLALEEKVNFTEGRPFGGQSSPAFANQVVDIARAVLWPCQGNARRSAGDSPLREPLQIFDDGLLAEFLIGTLPGENEDLPQGDGKRPHVTLGRIFPLDHTIIFRR